MLNTFVRNFDGSARVAFFGSNANIGYSGTGYEGMGINYGALFGAGVNDSNALSDCEVGEILVYDKPLSSNECQRVETYLAQKYNLTSNLLPPHPLVTTPTTFYYFFSFYYFQSQTLV